MLLFLWLSQTLLFLWLSHIWLVYLLSHWSLSLTSSRTQVLVLVIEKKPVLNVYFYFYFLYKKREWVCKQYFCRAPCMLFIYCLFNNCNNLFTLKIYRRNAFWGFVLSFMTLWTVLCPAPSSSLLLVYYLFNNYNNLFTLNLQVSWMHLRVCFVF